MRGDVAGGFAIPEGADVMSNMWWLHRNDAFWPSPHLFDPSRFLDAAGGAVRPDHYFPFSMGVRGCPGQAVAFMISKLVAERLLARASMRTATRGGEPPAFKSNVMLPNTPVCVMVSLEAAPRWLQLGGGLL